MVNHPGTSNGNRDVNKLRSKKGKKKYSECGENICRCKKWPSHISCGYKYMYIVITNLRHSRGGASNYKYSKSNFFQFSDLLSASM